MAEEGAEERIVKLLLKFAGSGVKGGELGGDVVRRLISDIALPLMDRGYMCKIAECVSSRIARDTKQDGAKSKKTEKRSDYRGDHWDGDDGHYAGGNCNRDNDCYGCPEQANMLILFLDCLYSKHGDESFLSIDLSWVFYLIKLNESYDSCSLLSLLRTVLLLIEKAEKGRGRSFSPAFFLLNLVKERVEDTVKQDAEKYALYKMGTRSLGSGESSCEDSSVEKDDYALQSYKNILDHFDLGFGDLCNLFALIVEKEKNSNSDNHISHESDEYRVRDMAKEVMYLLPYVGNGEMRNHLIKSFCLAVKEWIFSREDFEKECLNVARLMFILVGNGDLCVVGTPHAFNSEGIERGSNGYTEQEGYSLADVYRTFCENIYHVKDRKFYSQLLCDIYNFLILYIDYIYNVEFVKSAQINDVRYFFLLFKEAYKDEEVLKKVIFLYSTIKHICEEVNYQKDIAFFLQAWELYECTFRCINNFSVHLLKTNWNKVIDLLCTSASIRSKYEKLKNESSYFTKSSLCKLESIKLERQNQLKDKDGDVLLFSQLDFYIFTICVRGKNTFCSYCEWIMLVLTEYILWLLLVHSNNTVTRFSLCEIISYENRDINVEKPFGMNKEKEECLDIHILLNTMSDIFLFNIFFIESVKPTFFIKGDMPFYEFRIKNMIITKILKRTDLTYAYEFFTCLDRMNLLHTNARIILESLLQAICLMEQRSSDKHGWSGNDLRKEHKGGSQIGRSVDLHGILISVVKKVKNVCISRREDALILLLQVVTKLNDHLDVFISMKRFSIFLELFEESFFSKHFNIFEMLLSINRNRFSKEKQNYKQVKRIISTCNSTSDLLNVFFEEFNAILSLNMHVYFYGFMRLFHLIVRQKGITENNDCFLFHLDMEDINELTSLLILYSFKNGLDILFEKSSMNSVVEKYMTTLRSFLGNGDSDGLAAKRLLLFADTLECISSSRGISSNHRVDGSNVGSGDFFTGEDSAFCEEAERLYRQCAHTLEDLNGNNTQGGNFKKVLCIAYMANMCTFVNTEEDDALVRKILYMEIKKGNNETHEKEKNYREDSKRNSSCSEYFHFYKYKYVYKRISQFSLLSFSNDNELYTFSEKVINDIEVCTDELVYVYFIIRRLVIPSIFCEPPINSPPKIDSEKKKNILMLLLKQSSILIDRCCACKYPTHLLEDIFITMFDPMIVKYDMDMYTCKCTDVYTDKKGIFSSEIIKGRKKKARKEEDLQVEGREENCKQKKEIPFLLLDYVKKILEDSKTKLSLSRCVVIPFLTSYFYSIIENDDVIHTTKEYVDRFIETIVDILMYKEYVLVDSKKSFTNNTFKIKRGNINIVNFINEKICYYFLNKIQKSQHINFPSELYEIYHTSIFLRILTLIFLISLFRILDEKYISFRKIAQKGKDKEFFYRKRNLILSIYERLIVHILHRIDNRNVHNISLMEKVNNREKKKRYANNGDIYGKDDSSPPLPSSNGHNIQIRGLQTLCCLSMYFKHLKKSKRKNIISYVNNLLHYDHLNSTRQYLELFFSSICNSSFVLVYPHLVKNISEHTANTQLTVSCLMICSYIFLKSKFSYYSFRKLHHNSFANACLVQKKYSANLARTKSKKKKKVEGKKIRCIINQIVKRNQNNADAIAQAVRDSQGKRIKRGTKNMKGARSFGKEGMVSPPGNRAKCPEGSTKKGVTGYHKCRDSRKGWKMKSQDEPLNRPLNGPLNRPLNGPLNGPLNEPQNEPPAVGGEEGNYFYSEHICRCLSKLLHKVVCLCSSHAALIRSIAQFILYTFLKKKRDFLTNSFFASIYSYIKNNKDCKRIRKKMKMQFKYWDVSFFEDIRVLLPAYNYSFNYFDEDLNYEDANTFAHVLYNHELVTSYTFIDTVKKIVQQEMSAIMFNVDLERQRQTQRHMLLSKNNTVCPYLPQDVFTDMLEKNLREGVEMGDGIAENSTSIEGKRKPNGDIRENMWDGKKSNVVDLQNGEGGRKNEEAEDTGEVAHCNTKDEEQIDNILEKNRKNYQKKFDPIASILMVNNEFRRMYQQRKKNNLIVIASLIDKVPNLAGLCRTCEIFNVKKLLIDNVNIVKDFQFKKISSTANKWVNVKELKKGDIINYLIKKRKKYFIIGLEQTNNSQRLNDFIFPKKCILILGDEKEGLPSSILLFLHHCVEIPGQGIIRSLNVHVSAAITIYEYFKQQS
ncbi:rRNA (adenosine-2'-O-)-methyltransferase, putative [Plasmodium ovale]|uniref:rRNA (Adenosine-2'-O-)-methyltransferase, putative n=1 Tax=Plasmodium ovale TaxID=36330 RepID=A0A1D3TME7_PLAOA|nr:rRNA (adenosine-2'-O-)-methyltransferase, putative [Plasmodium ovale]